MSDDVALTEDLLIERIREAGLRLTLTRRAIVRALADGDEAFKSAQMIIDRVSDSGGYVDPSTVYRTLDDLARLELIHHVPGRNGRSGTWHVTLNQDHVHLVCENCRRAIEVPETEFAPFSELLRGRYGFKTKSHHVAFLGSCNRCEDHGDHPYPQRAEQEVEGSSV